MDQQQKPPPERKRLGTCTKEQLHALDELRAELERAGATIRLMVDELSVRAVKIRLEIGERQNAIWQQIRAANGIPEMEGVEIDHDGGIYGAKAWAPPAVFALNLSEFLAARAADAEAEAAIAKFGNPPPEKPH